MRNALYISSHLDGRWPCYRQDYGGELGRGYGLVAALNNEVKVFNMMPVGHLMIEHRLIERMYV